VLIKAVIIGAAGMVGHVLFHELRKKNIDIIGITRRKTEADMIQLDLYTQFDRVKQFLLENRFDIIFNCSAILVNQSNLNKLQAVYINSFFPHWLIDLFKNKKTKIIHLSTGGVFAGNDEFYFENNSLSPQTFYGITKAAGEFENNKDLVIRSDFWGPDIKQEGTGLFNWFLNQNGSIKTYKTVFFNGISNIEFAHIILNLIENIGIIHLGTDEVISKHDFLEKIKKTFNLKNITLIPEDVPEKKIFLKTLRNSKRINNYDTMIKEVHQYLRENFYLYKNVYPKIYTL
jgi:dTDP-4-dehydrorhamnose reductase